jgi:succinate dehydrogenase / fumarate reductase, cytochrome b subunit
MSKAVSFIRSTVGKKVLMSASGAVLVGYVLVHMLANLQIFLGADAINEYAASLRRVPILLWGVRAIMVVAFGVHIVTALQLTALKASARPHKYKVWTPIRSTLASRSMIYTGVLLMVFVLLHLMNLTWGNVHPDFVPGDVFHNAVVLFRNLGASGFYLMAMIMLAAHLSHGAWSMWQSVGLNGPRYTGTFRWVARVLTTVVAVGNIAIVVALLTGVVG